MKVSIYLLVMYFVIDFPLIYNDAVTVGADGAGNICINCAISSQSDALGCVMLLHPVNDFNNITVREVNKNLQQPYCIHAGRDIFSIAVFEWKSDGFPSFQPAVFKVTTIDKPSKCYNIIWPILWIGFSLVISISQFPNTQCFLNNQSFSI